LEIRVRRSEGGESGARRGKRSKEGKGRKAGGGEGIGPGGKKSYMERRQGK
jgi:hypothetical protein